MVKPKATKKVEILKLGHAQLPKEELRALTSHAIRWELLKLMDFPDELDNNIRDYIVGKIEERLAPIHRKKRR